MLLEYNQPATAADLADFRKYNRLSISDAAKTCGVGRASWYSWEIGERQPPRWLILVLISADKGHRVADVHHTPVADGVDDVEDDDYLLQ